MSNLDLTLILPGCFAVLCLDERYFFHVNKLKHLKVVSQMLLF